jgi:glutathione S-transferase
MIVVHHLNASRSQRVLWLLEELGVPYEVKRYQRDPKTMLAPAELRQVHPLGKSPVVTDDGTTVAESGAIVEYLIDRYDRTGLRPPVGSADYQRYRYWLHYAEGSAMPPLLLNLVVSRLGGPNVPWLIRPVAGRIAAGLQKQFIGPQITRHLDFMEQELATRDWFAGTDFTAADIQMSFPLEVASVRAGLDATRPKLWSWLRRIHERPAYQRALATGGPYELLR